MRVLFNELLTLIESKSINLCIIQKRMSRHIISVIEWKRERGGGGKRNRQKSEKNQICQRRHDLEGRKAGRMEEEGERSVRSLKDNSSFVTFVLHDNDWEIVCLKVCASICPLCPHNAKLYKYGISLYGQLCAIQLYLLASVCLLLKFWLHIETDTNHILQVRRNKSNGPYRNRAQKINTNAIFTHLTMRKMLHLNWVENIGRIRFSAFASRSIWCRANALARWSV